MPCDTRSNDHIEECFVLYIRCLYQNEVEYCIIAGDLNTDLIRHSSDNTISINVFIEHDHLVYVLKLIYINVSPYSLFHFIITQLSP